MTTLITYRLPQWHADMLKGEEIKDLLLQHGIDPKTCICYREGREIVYEQTKEQEGK
jgi:hypothetical protein